MVTITRRFRRVISPTPEPNELDEVRKRTREVLNRPFTYRPKPTASWEEAGTDPFYGYFKPFSKVIPITRVIAPVQRTTRWVLSRRSLLVGGALVLLLLIGLLSWKIFFETGRFSGVVSPLPPRQQANGTSTQKSSPTPPTVPAGTQLQQGGPNNSVAPTRNGNSNNRASSLGNVGSPTTNSNPSTGGGSGGGTNVGSIPLCTPLGCTYTSPIPGVSCSSGCTIIHTTSPVPVNGTGAGLVTNGDATDGSGPCTSTNPCVLVKYG